MAATCDVCDAASYLHRHHECRDPDVILMLCVSCHEHLHRVRGVPGRARFDATLGLTVNEARAVVFCAAIDGVSEFVARGRYTVAQMLGRLEYTERKLSLAAEAAS